MRHTAVILFVIAALSLAGCGNSQGGGQSTTAGTSAANGQIETEQATAHPEDGSVELGNRDTTSGNTLIAYFSVMETDGVDTVAGASRVAVDGEVLGNCQYITRLIQQSVGGDLFAIETVQEYPGTHEPLLDFAWEEKAENARPQLATQIDNLEDYNTIFLGYPNMEQGFECVLCV